SRRRFPVLENNKLVGQVSRKDVVIAAINLKSQSWR
ncbi:MAG: putative transcriptional regulator, partial [Candidatus Arcticimaribacter sp.]